MTKNDQAAKKRGIALAEAALKRRALDRKKRRAAVSAGTQKKPGAKGVSAKAAIPKAPLVKAAGGAGSNGTLIAEGDSWFDYPLNDVLKLLEDEHGYDVEHVAHKGDFVEDMAYNDGQLDDFIRLIDRSLRRGEIPKAILLSGGGNDVTGNEFTLLLEHALSPAPGINERVLDGVIDVRLRNSYYTILAAVTRICEETTGRRLPIITHGYDYAVPDGRGFLGGGWFLPGPWLDPGFRRKGYTEMKPKQTIVNQLMDRFNGMLKSVAQDAQFKHVTYVDLRDTLLSWPDKYKQHWANELHPNKAGFQKVTAKIAQAIP